jgi:hypothetical protein
MHVESINDITAVDLDTADCKPSRELETCNHLLDEPAALKEFYEQNGYLLGRRLLNVQSITEARDAMLAVAVRRGLVKPGDKDGLWTGQAPKGGEEGADFQGISSRLFSYADNLAVLEKMIFEKACWVPNVSYRLRTPGGFVTPVHQDGFYSPGIHNYRPVWVPLLPCPRKVGGLMIAVGQHRRGYFHNLAKPAPYAIPVGVIEPDSWATSDFEPGDVLIIHPYAPHASMPNTSDQLRVTLDTRVQSSANPTALAATVLAVTPVTIRVKTEDAGDVTYRVDKESYIRVTNPGSNDTFERFAEVTKPGMRLVIVHDGDYALMLRQAAEA